MPPQLFLYVRPVFETEIVFDFEEWLVQII